MATLNPEEKDLSIFDRAPDSPIYLTHSARPSMETLHIPPPFSHVDTRQQQEQQQQQPHPSDPLPDYTSATSRLSPTLSHPLPPPLPLHISIPLQTSTPTSPFLQAYPASLLPFGIPKHTWLAFLTGLSSFRTASPSRRALSHASDLAFNVASVPSRMGRDLASHSVSCSRQIASGARGLDLGGVVGGVVGLTLGSVGQVVAEAARLPFKTAGAVVKGPRRTVGERGMGAFVRGVNEGWLGERGLRVRVVGNGGVRGVDEILERGGGEGKVVLGVEEMRGVMGEVIVEGREERVEVGRETLCLIVERV